MPCMGTFTFPWKRKKSETRDLGMKRTVGEDGICFSLNVGLGCSPYGHKSEARSWSNCDRKRLWDLVRRPHCCGAQVHRKLQQSGDSSVPHRSQASLGPAIRTWGGSISAWTLLSMGMTVGAVVRIFLSFKTLEYLVGSGPETRWGRHDACSESRWAPPRLTWRFLRVWTTVKGDGFLGGRGFQLEKFGCSC